ncbi:Ras family protein [Diplocarpon rosae]|nr:Ras family protein [Diplocarpon rosae]
MPSSSDNPQRITITICGDGGCGKSSITLRLVRSQWTHEYDPTIEDSYSITRTVDGATYHLSLTDTAGQEEYRGMWASSNLRSDAFLLVYDITSLSSLGALEEYNELIDREAETRMDAWEREHFSAARRKKGAAANKNARNEDEGESPPVTPIKIVAGNKCDLQESRQVPAQMGLEWARKHGCGFMETSARNTVNIEETFALIIRRVVEARRVARMGSALGLEVGEGGGGSGPESVTGGSMRGARRAVTAPLSPLPGGSEKGPTLELMTYKEE